MRFSGCVPNIPIWVAVIAAWISLCFTTGDSMQVDDDVSQEDIKTAYRQAAKFCHPDVNDAGHELCILLNEVCRAYSQCRWSLQDFE